MRSLRTTALLLSILALPFPTGACAGTDCDVAYSDLTKKQKYPTMPMQEKFIGEDQGKVIDGRYYQVKYLNPDELEERRVAFTEDGVLNSKGELIRPHGKYIFVMDEHGNFYISTEESKGRFHHSSLFAGGRVAAAGEMTFRDGKLVGINRTSGHYLPNRDSLKNALLELERDGLDLHNIWTGEDKTAYQFVYIPKRDY